MLRLTLTSILVVGIAIGSTVASPSRSGGGAVAGLAQATCSGAPPSLTIRASTEIVGMPNTASGPPTQPCRIKIQKQDGICQVRVDFLSFNVGVAGAGGDCPNDYVSFKSENLPDGLTLCGAASGQHLYLHFGHLDTLYVNTNLFLPQSSYHFAVTLIECGPLAGQIQAPSGCTQYYTTHSAEVQSFNFPVQQLNSQLYTICVARDYGETIQWQSCPANSTFSISGIDTPAGSGFSGRGDACATDFIYIPPRDKFCGTYFDSIITSKVAPFFMVVNFDAAKIPSPPTVLDPVTGCPNGFTCNLPPGALCGPNDSCSAPPWFMDLIDGGNVGFCLKYSITPTLKAKSDMADDDVSALLANEPRP